MSGEAAPNYKDGRSLHRSSRYLPPKIAARVQEALADPELLSINSDVALLDARWSILAERLFTGESGELWKRLRETWHDVKTAADADLLRAAMKAHDTVIQSATKDAAAWRELIKITNNRASLKQASMNQQVALQQMVALSDAMVLGQRIVEAVNDVVTDVRQRAAISAKLVELLNWKGVTPSPARQLPAAVAATNDSQSPPEPQAAVVVSSSVAGERVNETAATPPPDTATETA